MTGDAPRIRRTTLLGLLAILAFAAAVRVRLADVPLERDEGEYAYIGQLALQGVPPFVDAYTMKLPGTAYAYAAIMALGGQSARAIHLGLLLVNAATILLVFALGRRLLDERAAVIAAGFFALLSLDRGVMGVWAHATHFALLFALAGLAFLERAERQTRPSRVFLAGGLLGIAVLMKQHAGLFFVAGLLLVAYDRPRDGRRDHGALLRTILWLTLGFALPLVGLVAWVAAQGVFAQFWFWTVRYGTRYLGEAPMGDALDRLRAGLHPVVDKTFAIWILAAGGAALLHVARWPARTRVAMGGLAVASGLAVCPGLYFREHYFILALPAVALLAAIAVESMGALLLRVGRSPRLAWFATVGLAVVCAGQYLASEHRYLFSMSSEALSRNRYKANLFVDVVAIADYLRDTRSLPIASPCSDPSRSSSSTRTVGRRPATFTSTP
jgi:4-amino-4-deoxy-L-arabinose transferase-like glycosyltransferase